MLKNRVLGETWYFVTIQVASQKAEGGFVGRIDNPTGRNTVPPYDSPNIWEGTCSVSMDAAGVLTVPSPDGVKRLAGVPE